MSSKGRVKSIKVQVFGWGSLEREIARYPNARNAFDPNHTPINDSLEEKIELLPEKFEQKVSATLGSEFDSLREEIRALQTIEPVSRAISVYSEQEKQINDCVELIDSDPASALRILQGLEKRLTNDTPKNVKFRVKTNIAACQLKLGSDTVAANGFIEAWKIDPEQPKAASNKAFGLLLKGDLTEARTISETLLEKFTDNAALAACYIQSLVDDESVNDPLSKVPQASRNTPEVAEAYILWLIKRGRLDSWWDAAIAAHTAHPNNEELKVLYANALLDRILGGSSLQEPFILTDHERSDAIKACSILEAKWTKYNQGSRYARGDWPTVAINLMLAYRILGEKDKAKEIGTQALKCFPGDPTIKEYVATILANLGEVDQAAELIDGLEPNLRNIGLRFNLAYSKGDWNTVVKLVNKHLDVFPAADRSFIIAARTRANVEIAPAEQREEIFSAVKDEIGNDVRALVILSEGSRIHGLNNLADEFFESAKLAFGGGESNHLCRLSLAQEAMARREPGFAAEILIDNLPLDRFSDELILLAEALVFDFPIRERALCFFDKLDPQIRRCVVFQNLEGVLHYNRGVPQDAVRPFSIVYQREPTIKNFMRLVQTNMVSGEKGAVAVLLREAEIEKLKGEPHDRIKLAQVLLEFGYGDRALDCGYRALVDGLDNESVVLKYFGLVLKPSQDRPDTLDQVVESGKWVRLTSSKGDNFETLIDEGEARPWGDNVATDNPFITKALGLCKGDGFENINSATGECRRWTVAEVKPCWLQAFHYLSLNFAQRFPDSTGFGVLQLADDDIEPILEQVRRHSEANRARANLYLRNCLPIVAVAGERPAAEISFSSYLNSIDEDLRVCVGTAAERATALNAIGDNRRTGAVLDAFTAWHAAGLGILPVLTEHLGPLAIPTSELQLLQAMVHELDFEFDDESMSLSFRTTNSFAML